MLGYYAERLNGVELNGSFYRTPPPATLAGWSRQSSAGFRFCFKGHRALTYSGEAFDREGVARDVGRRLAVLEGRLGPVLVQFPPTRPVDPAGLDGLLAALGVRAAVEFRDPSWFRDDVYRLLRAHGAALVVTDQEKWPRAPRLELSGTGYYRLRRDYQAGELERWRRELRSECEGRDELHVYFRHEPQAPAWAARMLES
jgi:uncharacterized protein YecE (DUF72 family)